MKGNPFMNKEYAAYKKNNITDLKPKDYYDVFQQFDFLMVHF